MNITRKHYGTLSNGSNVDIIELSNDHKITIKILTYGGIIESIITPDEKGFLKNIVLGKDNLEGYEKDESSLGAIVGPTAGRISLGHFTIDDRDFSLDNNGAKHSLHGGAAGLGKKTWTAELEKRTDSVKLVLTFLAADGEGGYPGNRIFKTTYILNNKNQLLIYFDATTDKDTIINLSSHSYFNMSNEDDNIYDTLVMMNAQKALHVDGEMIPDGQIDYVLGTPYNFSRGAKLGEALKGMKEGIDRVYIINKAYGVFGISSKAVDEKSGRTLDLVTDQPGVVLYTSNHFDGSEMGRNGKPLIRHGAFCLEPQHFPDAPNHDNFPCITVRAGEIYKSRNQFTFGLVSHSHHH
ncbi:aldose epimerase family protein [Lentimicrobium sp. S6]|uniref:aldose epimerase family protein n=1 Tax=Lentimicrobium sp. S6 TaxID=2735872 RepID=UPI0015526092|nr:aldose epimerase family protein [Lentimicrobium sp. S6]NPD46294.1 galactose mutarotase [Lentimicrobium sp. S6]